MFVIRESRIERGRKMPSMCELCSSIHKHNSVGTDAEHNACFEKWTAYKSFPPEQQEKLMSYQPFTNSKRTIIRTCKHFAHVKSVREW